MNYEFEMINEVRLMDFLNIDLICCFSGLSEHDDEAHEEEERKKISCGECIIRSY
jgi:hypothetical protein